MMNFSMFSCNHFNNFLSDPIGKQSTMSKRVAKPRSACLVSRNLLSARQPPSSDSSASHDPVNQELGRTCFFVSTGKFARDRVQSPATNSQEWQKDDYPFMGREKFVRGIEHQLPGQGWTTTICKSPTASKTPKGWSATI